MLVDARVHLRAMLFMFQMFGRVGLVIGVEVCEMCVCVGRGAFQGDRSMVSCSRWRHNKVGGHWNGGMRGGMRGQDVSARARNPLRSCPSRSPRRRLGLLPELGAVPVHVVRACHQDEVEPNIAHELP